MTDRVPDPEPSGTVPSVVPLPFVIKLAAGLMILSGLDGVADLVLAILGKDHEGRLFNLVFLLIGYGLLRRSQNALGCTTVLFGILAIVAMATLIALAIPSCRDQMEFDRPVSLPVGLVLVIGLGAVSVLFLYWLRVPNVREFFSVRSSELETREAKSWTWVLAIVAGCALVEVHLNEIEHRRMIEGAFHFDTIISGYDATTDDFVESISLQLGTSFSSEDRRRPRLSSRATGKLHEIQISGIAFAPFSVRIGAEGNQRKEIEITSATSSHLSVDLDPIRIEDTEAD